MTPSTHGRKTADRRALGKVWLEIEAGDMSQADNKVGLRPTFLWGKGADRSPHLAVSLNLDTE